MAKNQQPKTENTPAVIIPVELSPVLKDTKIEINKAQGHAMAFAPAMQDYITLSAVINDLDKVNPSEMDAKRAREARLKMVKVRTGAEEIKDLRKEGIKAEGDLIQALYNVVKNSCIVSETELQEIEKHQERAEAKRQAGLADSRRELLVKYDTDTSYLPLGIMTDEQFTRLLDNESLAFTARVEAAEKVEAARIEAERLAEEAEQKRLRLQAERVEAERLEAIRVKEELAAKESELEKERKDREIEQRRIEAEIQAERKAAHEKFEAEQKRVDAEAKRVAEIAKQAAEKLAKENAEKLAEQNRLAKIESDKQAKLLAEQKQANEKLQAEKLAKENEAAKIEADKQAALIAPDKEKVNQLYKSLRDLEIPKFQSDAGIAIAERVTTTISQLLNEIKELSKNLK